MFYDILEELKKSQNWDLSKGDSPWFFLNIGNFFHLFFILGKLGLKHFFHDTLEIKKNFLDYKNKKLKKSKNWGFSKGFSPWFCQKLVIFPFLYFQQNSSEKCVSRYSIKRSLKRTIKGL